MAADPQSLARELKQVMRLARDPRRLEGKLPILSGFHRVAVCGAVAEDTRVHFILHRLIPAYLGRLPSDPDYRAISQLLTCYDEKGRPQNLRTRYDKAIECLPYRVGPEFDKHHEPRLLALCAERFIALDGDDRLEGTIAPRPEHPVGGIVAVHKRLDYHLLMDYMTEAENIMVLNTYIPELTVLADAIIDALAGGSHVSILLLYPESPIAIYRSRALPGGLKIRPEEVGRRVRRNLDDLAGIASAIDSEAGRQRLRVRIYDSLPSMSVFRVDGRTFFSFFPHGETAVESYQMEVTDQESPMGRLVADELGTFWDIGKPFKNLEQWETELERMGPSWGATHF
jgi:hypothetical protein